MNHFSSQTNRIHLILHHITTRAAVPFLRGISRLICITPCVARSCVLWTGPGPRYKTGIGCRVLSGPGPVQSEPSNYYALLGHFNRRQHSDLGRGLRQIVLRGQTRAAQTDRSILMEISNRFFTLQAEKTLALTLGRVECEMIIWREIYFSCQYLINCRLCSA